jgi:hypothetical protein
LVDATAEEACLVDRLCDLVVGARRTKTVAALVGRCRRDVEGVAK